MTLPAISNCISPNLFPIQENFEQQAIEIFGKDLAQDLKIKDSNWEKLMLSWNVFHSVCKIIKDLNIHFSEEINPIVQSENGLIVTIFNSGSITRATLTTPFGFTIIQCNIEVIDRFIECLKKKFYIQPLNDTTDNVFIDYSCTLSSEETAGLRFLYGHSRSSDEMGRFAFSRSHGVAVCNIIKELLNMEIRGIPQSISIGIQTDDSYIRKMQNYNTDTSFSDGYNTC